MLPDLPSLKKDLQKSLDTILRKRVNSYLGIVSEVPRSKIFEGGKTVIVRENGDRDETPMISASAEIVIKTEEIPTINITEIIGKIDVAANNMAAQISKHFFESISAAADKVGNTVNANGQPLSAEKILEVYEKIWMDFDESGRPEFPQLVVSPNQQQVIMNEFKRLESEPELRARFDQIIQQKRENWRARQASRKLVG